MSVLIKGMKMPKNCEDCRFEDFGGCMFRVQKGDCPLMKVPEAITDKLALIYESAKLSGFIRKPWAWTLYQTWKWCDQHETERGEKHERID